MRDGEKIQYQGKKITLVTFPIVLPGGTPYEMEFFEHPGASAIVPLRDGKVTLIRQYRYAAGGFIWEIPAGTLDSLPDDETKREDPLVCAKRELLEEAGLRATTWTPLGLTHTVPSFCDETIYLFLAEDIDVLETAHEQDEVIEEIREVPFEQAMSWIDDGTINDAKTIVALSWAYRKIQAR